MDPNLLFLALGIFILSFGGTALSAPRLIRLHNSRGWVDHPGGRKTQPTAVPHGGGLAVLLGFSLPVVVGLGLAGLETAGHPLLPDSVSVHADGILSRLGVVAAILVGSTLMLALGRLDDRRNLGPGIRIVAQSVISLAVVLAGVQITAFLPWSPLQVALTVLWLVFVTNATNFIDNMDGLLPGCGLASCLGIFTLAACDGQLFVAAFAAALGGGLLAFLWFNRPPARLYLGDEGSMFLGFLFASLVVVTSFQGTHDPDDPTAFPFLAPLLVLIVPLLDAGTVILIRLGKRQAPWRGGRDHLSHRISRAGFGDRSAVLFLTGLAFAGSSLAVLIYGLDRTRLLATTPMLLIMLLCLLFAGRLKRLNP